MDGLTDMAKLIVHFRNSANAPESQEEYLWLPKFLYQEVPTDPLNGMIAK
jgi:hypothetical protein